ncbi:LPXTG cell wall anchor domain-containing protein [Mammaliicoccus sciuri]|uniref:LPXTG cell wall anchor domain-containing protein n=1 Tax=Mammaliicoccus sciuri TaxID=1296 RepID=UPI0011886460|nr:LPXTG cell wall anchor domain-containing protein [Mammaliicoccus sciuri]MBO1217896.1 LPXTG cell wall anchor domain-containing protein [Mammaliicoccus sciuri]MBO1231020.1 LPXTG cell wall anchor domain-containing protein [Mammaliicoccus sciuri]QDR64412.1 LPXTG cell wall anchor domain-containing protein [Mammaliicoccus sciuri]
MLKKILLSTLLCTTVTTPLIGKVNAEEMKQDKPVKYVFKSGGKASAIEVNYDGSMTIPEPGGELWDVDVKPVDFYITKNGVQTNEVNPKYKHIWDQWAYYDFYASKGRTADLFVGEHPRPLDGVTFIPKSDKTSDDNNVNNPKDEPKSDQTEPNQNNTDNKSKSDQPKQDVPAKVEQPAKVDKKSNSQGNVVDKKDATDQNKSDTNKDNKAVANNKSNDQNKVAVNNQKSEPQTSDVSKKVDVKKEDNNKDVKTKDTSSKAKAADNKSDKQQKELPKTGESENTLFRTLLFTCVVISLLGIHRLKRKANI